MTREAKGFAINRTRSIARIVEGAGCPAPSVCRYRAERQPLRNRGEWRRACRQTLLHQVSLPGERHVCHFHRVLARLRREHGVVDPPAPSGNVRARVGVEVEADLDRLPRCGVRQRDRRLGVRRSRSQVEVADARVRGAVVGRDLHDSVVAWAACGAACRSVVLGVVLLEEREPDRVRARRNRDRRAVEVDVTGVRVGR